MKSENAIISPNSRIRHPEYFVIGEGSILDDYCYISTRVVIGRYSHVASGCSIAGGVDRTFTLGDFSSVSAGVRIWCASDDFVNDLVCAPTGSSVKRHVIIGDVTMSRYTSIGSNSVIMPGNEIPEGVAIGALSYVPCRFKFEPYTVYAGIPVRKLKLRNKAAVQEQAASLEKEIAKRESQS